MLHPKQLGPFRIVRVIGRGGMGAVYEAIHEETNETVAVKMLLNPPDEESNDQKNRFEAEIETLKRLRHPNIVRLHGFGQEEGLLYYAMEYVNGPSLQTFLKKKRLFTWEEVVFIGVEICKALKHAHDRGIIHRDVKPANILLVDDGQIKVSDYGIAHFFGNSRMTDCNMVIGTIEYMSPEQAQAGPLTPRSDIYSLGALMYALITGNPPYIAKNLPEILKKYKEGPPESVRFTRPEVPPIFDQLILELLRIRPDKRPLDARLIGRRLEAIRLAYSKDPDQNPFLLKSSALQEQFYQDKDEEYSDHSNPDASHAGSEYHSYNSSSFSDQDASLNDESFPNESDALSSDSRNNPNTGHYQPIISDTDDVTDSRIHLENTSADSSSNEETCLIGSLHATFSKNNGPLLEFPISSSGEATVSQRISFPQNDDSTISNSENTDFVLYDNDSSALETISTSLNAPVKKQSDHYPTTAIVTKEISTKESAESCSDSYEDKSNVLLSTKTIQVLTSCEESNNPLNDHSEATISLPLPSEVPTSETNNQFLETRAINKDDLNVLNDLSKSQSCSPKKENELIEETVSMTQVSAGVLSPHSDSFLEHPNETTILVQNEESKLNYLNSLTHSVEKEKSNFVPPVQYRQDQSHDISKPETSHIPEKQPVLTSITSPLKESSNQESLSSSSDHYSSLIPTLDDSKYSGITLNAPTSDSFSFQTPQIHINGQEKKPSDKTTLFSTNDFVFDPSTAQPLPPHIFEKKTHFTAVDESELDKLEVYAPPLISLKTWIFSAILIVVGLVVWFLLQPPAADTLYYRIVTKIQPANNNDNAEWVASLRSVENDLIRFSEYYPNDSRMNEIQYYKDELEIEELDRKLDRFIERKFIDQKSLNLLSSVEASYVIMMRQVKNDSKTGIKRLQDFIHFFSTNIISSSIIDQKPEDNNIEKSVTNSEEMVQQETERQELNPLETLSKKSFVDDEQLRRRILIQTKPGQCVLLAERKLALLEKEQQLIQKKLETLLDEQILLADDLMNNDPNDAYRLQKNIVLFFGNYDWATSKIQKINDSLKLNSSEKPTTEP